MTTPQTTPSAEPSFYWYDFETFGLNRRTDRPAQFAGLRTDIRLRPVEGAEGEGEVFYCRPSGDYLPSPESCLLTGITPQLCEERGICEADFAKTVFDRFNRPGTVSLGYNTSGFDDEVSRFLFWRNFLDPYRHGYKNGCSRWDIYPLTLAVWALRGESIVWPTRREERDGVVRDVTSFRLETLTKANGIAHGHAHDALSDVGATLGLARLIAEREPRLWQWAFENRTKERVLAAFEKGPVVWVSPKLGQVRGFTRIVMRLVQTGSDAVVWDLTEDPQLLRTLSREELLRRLFAGPKDLAEGESPLPIWKIKTNAAPFVCASLGVLNAERAARCGIDLERVKENARLLMEILPAVQGTVEAAVADHAARRSADAAGEEPEADLYSKFVDFKERNLCDRIVGSTPEHLARLVAEGRLGFEDERLKALLPRYRARNWPETLTSDELETWRRYCEEHVIEGAGGARTVGDFFEAIDEAQGDPANETEERAAVLEALYDWGERVGNAATGG